MIGANGSSAMVTLVERSTRYTMLRELPLTHDSATVTEAVTSMMLEFPQT